MVDRRAKLFWDILNCGTAIQSFLRDQTIEDYRNNLMLRSAVERQFEIIGEALRRLELLDAPLLYRISDARRIIDFRNAISHGYDGVDDAIVWQVISEKLPVLMTEVRALLAEVAPPSS
ncbi:MAG: DUF86 domain-containing protein [Hyphomicrobiaceae bacterium]